LAVNPLLLRFDVGFQLSFLAVSGIIFLSPWLRKALLILFKKRFSTLQEILAMTFSAQVFTLPIMVFGFGQISLIAPLSNILILPILPLILGLGFAFCLFGLIWNPLAWILSWPIWLMLSYLLGIVDWFSQISFFSISF
jgi:competence protein ComEC